MNPSAALPIRSFLKDPRHFQIVFLSLFLVFGILRLHWDADILRYTILLSTVLTVQYLFIRWKKLDIRSLKSALITGLGLCLLFHASAPWVLVLGAAIAIAGKFLVRFRGKHIFNPANLGIVAAILLTGQAWVSPGQWGSGPVLVFLVGAAGLMVLLRVGRIDTSVAFLLTFAGLDLLRTVLYLGWGLDVWAHRMMNGSLLLFAFFMITDPMTTPNAPRARIAWSMIIALITFVVSTFAYVHTAPIWALVALCAITPLLDTLFAGERFSWLPGTTSPTAIPNMGTIPSDQRPTPRRTFNKPTRPMRTQAIAVLAAFLVAGSASAFCGFYVAKADATLFNHRSEVILVRDGRRTIITMSNDFKGSVQDFAMVVPVPSVLQQSDIRIVDRSVFQMLDNYSSPRLVEYWDENPCQKWEYALDEVETTTRALSDMQVLYAPTMREKDYGVTIEARYAVGEYDVLILGATESKGLKQWLLDNGYKIPATAHEVLDPYIKSGLKFFVVKVDLQRLQASGFDFLRPIQVSFESDKFMLPIRLGMANSSGVQDMIVYAFTRTGRVECVNYRTVKVRPVLKGPVQPVLETGRTQLRGIGICMERNAQLGWGEMRPVRRSASHAERIRAGRCGLGEQRRRPDLLHPPACALRQGQVPAGPAIPSDPQYRAFPSALYPDTSCYG